MTEAEHDVDFTGDEAEERAVLCVPCRRYQQLDRDGQPTCEHDITEAKTIEHLSGLEWAYTRLLAYRRELDRDDPFGDPQLLQMNMTSLVADLAFAGEEVPDPEDQERLEALADPNRDAGDSEDGDRDE